MPPEWSAIPYIEVVEEALCFGWIDSTLKSLSDGRLAQRLSPRRAKSHWTQLNMDRCVDREDRGQSLVDCVVHRISHHSIFCSGVCPGLLFKQKGESSCCGNTFVHIAIGHSSQSAEALLCLMTEAGRQAFEKAFEYEIIPPDSELNQRIKEEAKLRRPRMYE